MKTYIQKKKYIKIKKCTYKETYYEHNSEDDTHTETEVKLNEDNIITLILFLSGIPTIYIDLFYAKNQYIFIWLFSYECTQLKKSYSESCVMQECLSYPKINNKHLTEDECRRKRNSS